MEDIDIASPVAKRRRRHHTRSRAGCESCRRLHLRCDEGRPTCDRYLKAERECEYLQRGLPLREQRRLKQQPTLPGEQSPWDAAVIAPVLLKPDPVGQSFDPFGIFGLSEIGMPLQSARLLRYFSDVSRDSLKDPRTQCLPKVISDPMGLRSSLLLGLIHFAQKNGGLSYFSETFLHHKLTSIRLINEGLDKAFFSPEAFCESLRQIATLAVVELFLSPDLSAADTHMQGLVALMDRQPSNSPVTAKCCLEAEFTRRYFLLVATLMQCVKTRKALNLDNLTPTTNQSHDAINPAREYPLAVLCRIPSFLCPWAWSKAPEAVDVHDTITLLQASTRYTEERVVKWSEVSMAEAPVSPHPLVQSEDSVTYASWIDCVDGHLSSMLESQKPMSVYSSWSGMHGSAAAYENFVTDRVGPEFIMGSEVLFHIVSIVVMDLVESRHHLESKTVTLQGPLWLWKAFVGSFSMRSAAQQQRQQQNRGCSHAQRLRQKRLRQQLDRLIREAALSFQIDSWPAAFALLSQVAWPSYGYRRAAFETAWHQITKGSAPGMD